MSLFNHFLISVFMINVMILLPSVMVVLLVRNSGTASIEIPMNIANISSSSSPYSLMNITEDEYSKGIIIQESNQSTATNYENEGIVVNIISDNDTNLDISNFIMLNPPQNITCIRRDYNEDVAAIFKEEVGPIDSAFIVFNTTYSSIAMGRILNTTELIGLKMLNETTVDCSEYSVTMSRRLNLSTIYSLTG